MRAEAKAFAKVQGRYRARIFILQMQHNIVSLNKHFGRRSFNASQGKAAKRYASL